MRDCGVGSGAKCFGEMDGMGWVWNSVSGGAGARGGLGGVDAGVRVGRNAGEEGRGCEAGGGGPGE